MANFIKNPPNLTEEKVLNMKEVLTQLSLNSNIDKFITFLREKYNLKPEDKFDCEHLNKIDSDLKELKEIMQKQIDLLPKSDW